MQTLPTKSRLWNAGGGCVPRNTFFPGGAKLLPQLVIFRRLSWSKPRVRTTESALLGPGFQDLEGGTRPGHPS
jgi:hypothetical protein